jgi:hypothetical protein
MAENCGPRKSTWKMGNKIGKLQSHNSSNMAYCQIPLKKWWTKGTICNSWYLRLVLYPKYERLKLGGDQAYDRSPD